MKSAALSTDEYGTFYQYYISLVPADITLRTALDDSAALLLDYFAELPDGKEDFAYAEGKWTIKQALQHIIDTERIFAYRALRLGRHDATPLAGFEQDDYVAAVDLSGRTLTQLVKEFRMVRDTTIALYAGFGADDLTFTGTASGAPMSCRAMGFVICGHTYHHEKLYRERYSG